MAMKLGLMFVNSGRFSEPRLFTHLAQTAERTGFESLWTVEHVVIPQDYKSPYPYSSSGKIPGREEVPIPDPLLPLAYAAAITKTIKLATGILILPQRHPLYVAKEVATLDVLSGGRMMLGIGSGWLKEEFEALGLDFSTRGARTDETIQAMRVLWRENPSSFRGKHISFEPVKSFPKPVQKNGIPIYIGGNSIPAIRRAARYGDGFIPTPQEDITPLIKLLRQECDKIGRNINEIDIIWGFYGVPSEDQLKRADDLGIKAIGSGIQFTNDLNAITRDLETLANKLVAR